jgi:prevent-host-death family protein
MSEGDDDMSMELVEFTEKLVPISDFSQGKAGKIFNDVAENNSEYIVLKNNQPTAVVISIQKYSETQNKLSKLERLLENIENVELE